MSGTMSADEKTGESIRHLLRIFGSRPTRRPAEHRPRAFADPRSYEEIQRDKEKKEREEMQREEKGEEKRQYGDEQSLQEELRKIQQKVADIEAFLRNLSHSTTEEDVDKMKQELHKSRNKIKTLERALSDCKSGKSEVKSDDAPGDYVTQGRLDSVNILLSEVREENEKLRRQNETLELELAIAKSQSGETPYSDEGSIMTSRERRIRDLEMENERLRTLVNIDQKTDPRSDLEEDLIAKRFDDIFKNTGLVPTRIGDKTAVIESLQKENQRLKDEMKINGKEDPEIMRQQRQLEQQYADLFQYVPSIDTGSTAKNRDLTERLERQKQQLLQFRRELDTEMIKFENAKAEAKAKCENETQDLKDQLTRLQTAGTDPSGFPSASVTDLEQQMQASKTKYETKLIELQQQAKDATRDLKAKHLQDKNELRRRLEYECNEKFTTKVGQLQAQIALLKAEIASLKLQTSVQPIGDSADVSSLRTKVKNLSKRVQDLQKRNMELGKETQIANTRAFNLQSKGENLERVLQTRIATLEQKIVQLQKEKTIFSRGDNVETIKQQLAQQYQERVDAQEATLRDIRNKLVDKNDEIRQLQEYQKRVNAQEATIRDIRSKLADKNGEIRQLEETIEAINIGANKGAKASGQTIDRLEKQIRDQITNCQQEKEQLQLRHRQEMFNLDQKHALDIQAPGTQNIQIMQEKHKTEMQLLRAQHANQVALLEIQVQDLEKSLGNCKEAFTRKTRENARLVKLTKVQNKFKTGSKAPLLDAFSGEAFDAVQTSGSDPAVPPPNPSAAAKQLKKRKGSSAGGKKVTSTYKEAVPKTQSGQDVFTSKGAKKAREASRDLRQVLKWWLFVDVDNITEAEVGNIYRDINNAYRFFYATALPYTTKQKGIGDGKVINKKSWNLADLKRYINLQYKQWLQTQALPTMMQILFPSVSATVGSLNLDEYYSELDKQMPGFIRKIMSSRPLPSDEDEGAAAMGDTNMGVFMEEDFDVPTIKLRF